MGQLIESQYTESLQKDQQYYPQGSAINTAQPPPIVHMAPDSMTMNPMIPLQAYMTPEGNFFYAPAYPPLQPQHYTPLEGHYSPYQAPPPYTTGTTSPVYNPDMTSYQTMSYPVAMTPDYSSVGSSTTEPTELLPSSISQCVSGRSSVHSVPTFHQHTHMPEQQSFLHRQLKRLVTNGEAVNALDVYRNLETAGKAINVTETSALIEQLVRGDLMAEAVEITQSMLMKNMHPMPKIFR